MAFTKIVGAGIHTLSNVHTHNINSSGIITATNFVGIFSGTNGDFSGDVTIDGNLTVNGTTTTLDTVLTEVDKLEVAANNSTVGAAITQSGSGDILNLYDGSTEVLTVKDGGKIGINTTDTGHLITVLAQSASTVIARFKAVNKNSNFDISTDVSSHGSATVRNNIGAAKVKLNSNGASYFTGGNVGIGTDNPQSLLSLHQSGGGFEVNANSGSNNARLLSYDRPAGAYREMSFQALSYGFDTNGAEKFRITSDGHIEQTIGASNVGFDQVATSDHYISNVVNANRSAANDHIFIQRGLWNSKEVAAMKFRAGDDTTNKDDGYITFETSSANNITERLRINSYGQVGVNTTSPGALFGIAVDSNNTNALATGGIALTLKNTNTTDNSWVCMDFNNSVGGIVGRIGAQFKDTSDKDTDLYFATRANSGALSERLRIDSNGGTTITGTGSNLALNVSGGYIRSVGGQPSVVAHKSSSTFCHIGVEGNSNARAFLAYTNDKDFIIGRRSAYTGDNTGYSGADITVDKTNHAVQLSYNGGGRFVTTNEGATFSTGSSSCVVRLTSNNSSVHVLQAFNNDLLIKAPSSGGINLVTNASNNSLFITSTGALQHTAVSGVSYFTGSSEYLFNSTTSCPTQGGNEARVQINENKTRATMSINAFMDNSGGPNLTFISSRSGTIGVLGTKCINGDTLGQIRFFGDNATTAGTLAQGGTIACVARSTPSDGDTVIRGEMRFSLGDASAGTHAQRMKITGSGLVETSSTFGIANVGGSIGGSGGTENWIGIKDSSGTYGLIMKTHSATAAKVRNVGINETDPSNQLHIAGTTGTSAGGLLRLDATTGDNFIIFDNTHDSTEWVIGNDSTARNQIRLAYDAGSGYSTFVTIDGTTNNGVVTIDGGTNTLVKIKGDNSGTAGLRLGGDSSQSQSTGFVEVHQDETHGGGMFYNGDGSPAFANSGESADYFSLFRASGGQRHVVQRWFHASNDCEMLGNVTIDNGDSTLLRVRGNSAGTAGVSAGGDSGQNQCTGYLEVHQDQSHGGGISYNGDGSPGFVNNETADYVTFYRIHNGTRERVFHYSYSDNNVNFRGNIEVQGSTFNYNSGNTMRGFFTTATSNQNATNSPSLAGNLHYGYGYQEAYSTTGGAWTNPFPDLVLGYHTGVSLGGHPNYNGCRFFYDHPSVSSTLLLSVGNGSSGVHVTNQLTAGTKTFRIVHPHPSKKYTHDLVHSVIEGPQCDNIYRGKINLVGGTATVNIDTVSNMTDGTFVLLNRDIQCFTSNETGWTAVKGSVTGNILTITAQDNTCTDTISWMVVGERQDDKIKSVESPDENGKLIMEPLTIEQTHM